MAITELLQIAGVILAVLAGISVLVGNVYYVLRSKDYKITKEELAHCGRQHLESQAQIDALKHDTSTLQGQVATLRDIPLTEIRDGIKSIVVTNGKILDTLNHSAVDLKVNDRERKTAVRTVKTDLEAA